MFDPCFRLVGRGFISPLVLGVLFLLNFLLSFFIQVIQDIHSNGSSINFLLFGSLHLLRGDLKIFRRIYINIIKFTHNVYVLKVFLIFLWQQVVVRKILVIMRLIAKEITRSGFLANKFGRSQRVKYTWFRLGFVSNPLRVLFEHPTILFIYRIIYLRSLLFYALW